MQERHPDLFSDSRADQEIALAKPVFEHHLETLTTRNEEAPFEYFCRALAEKTIAPNLRAQSGPMGGGDGKVDGDTYPVAEAISERWWVGGPKEGEEWAFAFSAKKKWAEKVRGDVEKIAKTGRPYTRIYFITNQPAKASTRADIEKELRETHGIPVTILDRAWIVQQVYDHGHLALAVEKLNIAGVKVDVKVDGPLDAARIQELAQLDKRVVDPASYGGARYQLVEDIIEGALIARGLERPEFEIKARFLQAKSIAEKVGDPFQIMRVAYNRAWTAYWWFEDFGEFCDLYPEVERYALTADEAGHVEKLFNLWQLLFATHRYETETPERLDLAGRTQRLEEALTALSANAARPNNALQAETTLVLLRLAKAQAAMDQAKIEATWPAFESILDRCEHLGSYPVERLFDMSRELGKIFDSDGFDRFFERLVDVMRTRRSEGDAGQAYIERGGQKLQHGKPYDAIRMFGRAEALLVKEEYKAELVVALAGGSTAYDEAGLHWAARNKILAAAERSFSVLKTEGQVILPAFACLRRLAWIELRLGRIPHTILAMVMGATVRAHLNLEGDPDLDEEVTIQDAILGILLMRVPLEDLPELARLPATLDRYGLPMAEIAILHALGYDEKLRSDGYIPSDETPEGFKAFFEAWRTQPAAAQVAKTPILVGQKSNALRSTILGCELTISAPSDPLALSVAESLLGGLEAFLATSDEGDVFPYREHFEITMRAGGADMLTPALEFADTQSEAAVLTYPQDMTFADPAQTTAYSDWLQSAIVDVLVRMVQVKDVKSWLDKIAGEEKGFGRAVTFGNITTINRNVFGDPPKILLSDWIDAASEEFLPKRTETLADPEPVKPRGGPPKFGKGPPPNGFPNYDKLKHSDRKVLSPIDMPLWDKAKWLGIGYADYGPDYPPVMALLFKNLEAGRAIFEGWLSRYGYDTADQSLRIALITGLNKSEPATYGASIGPNFESISESDGRIFSTVARMHRMHPPTTENLDRFLKQYRKIGAFFIAPAGVDEAMTTPDILMKQALVMRNLAVREAWQIGTNDPDASILDDEDDDPIVPSDVTDPPVRAALEFIRELRKGRRE